MQTDKNDMKVEKNVSMHSHAFERLCKRQIVTDTKSCNASHMYAKGYSDPCQTSKVERFAKIVNGFSR